MTTSSGVPVHSSLVAIDISTLPVKEMQCQLRLRFLALLIMATYFCVFLFALNSVFPLLFFFKFPFHISNSNERHTGTPLVFVRRLLALDRPRNMELTHGSNVRHRPSQRRISSNWRRLERMYKTLVRASQVCTLSRRPSANARAKTSRIVLLYGQVNGAPWINILQKRRSGRQSRVTLRPLQTLLSTDTKADQ